MTPGVLNTTSVRGDPYTLRLPLVDFDTGAPLNLTGLTVTSQLRRFEDAPVDAECVVTDSDLPGGILVLHLPGSVTSDLARVYARDVQLIDGANDPVTIVTGTHTVELDVTR